MKLSPTCYCPTCRAKHLLSKRRTTCAFVTLFAGVCLWAWETFK